MLAKYLKERIEIEKKIKAAKSAKALRKYTEALKEIDAKITQWRTK